MSSLLKRFKTSIWLACCCFFVASLNAEQSDKKLESSDTTEVELWYKSYDSHYVNAILSQALQFHPNDKYTLKRSDNIEEGRAFANLFDETGVDIFVGGADQLRETYLEPIYIPLDRGLLGFRVCLTINKHLSKLETLNTVNDIKQENISMGSGLHWGDTQVLLQNGIDVVSSSVFANLFNMLLNERFECLPRGLLEVNEDLARFDFDELIVEQTKAIVYPMGLFIYVNRTKPLLKARVSQGLQAMLDSGDFDRIVKRHYMSMVQEHGLYNRKLLFLKNDQMSEKLLEAINQYGIVSFIE